MRKITSTIMIIVALLTTFLLVSCKNNEPKPIDREPVVSEEEKAVIDKFETNELIIFKDNEKFDNVLSNFEIISKIDKYNIFWESNNENIKIKNNAGLITRLDQDQAVELTATILIRDDLFKSRTFELVIKKMEDDGEVIDPNETYYKLTLPEGITADVSDLNMVLAGTDIDITIPQAADKDTLVFINGKYTYYSDPSLIEIEVNEDIVLTTQEVAKTTSIYEARKMINELATIKGIITGIIPDGDANYYYINDQTAAIMMRSAIHSHLKVGDLFVIEGLVSDYFNNVVIYPQSEDLLIVSNQPLPPAIYAKDVSKGTLDYENLTLQAQRFDVENLILKTKPTAGVNQNFFVADIFGNEVQVRFHKYLTPSVSDAIWEKVKDLEIGDTFSLFGVHLGQYKYKNDPYIVQFMVSDASEVEVLDEKVRHNVTFVLNNGKPNVVVAVTEGTNIQLTVVPRPTKSGYKFMGWTFDDAPYDFNAIITSPITISATWEETEEDPYDPVNPTDPNNQAVIENQKDPQVINYYMGINFNASASSLVSDLKTLVYAKELSYDSAKSWLLDADRDLVNRTKLRGIYDQALFNDRWDSAATWNREHVWPQSKLGSAGKGEAHNLRVSGVRINSSRGNMQFSETSSSTGNLGYSLGSYWWPGDVDKGDVARILMFMHLRHGLRLDNSSDGMGMGQLSLLFKWHQEDPVDAFEIQRNNVIYSWQGNRNPFIDQPQIFEKIWKQVSGITASAAEFREVATNTKLEYKTIQTTINLTFFKNEINILGA